MAGFDELQQALGLTHQPHGILLDRVLDNTFDPCEVYSHDWMHCIFVDGCFNAALYLLLESFIQSGMTTVYATIQEYVSRFVWPKWVGSSHLDEVFCESRKTSHRKAKHFKAQASDLMSLMPVLGLFIYQVLLKTGRCRNACLAFLSLIKVVNLIKAVPRGVVLPETLLAAVEECLSLFSAEFGFDNLAPKWHWMLHFHKHLERFESMLNCFVLERKHQVPKRYAAEFKNVRTGSSRHLLNEVTSHHLGQLSKPSNFSFDVGLVDGKTPSKRLRRQMVSALDLDAGVDIKTALVSRYSALGTCAKTDVVLVRDGAGFAAGQIQFHCEVDGEALSYISVFTLLRRDNAEFYAVWRKDDDGAQAVPTRDILDTVVYSKWSETDYCTILPYDLV